jgi:hypothetical protein
VADRAAGQRGERAAQVDTTFTAINNECTDAAVTMAEAALRHHRAADVLPVLRRMAPTNPLNERLHARFMATESGAMGKASELQERLNRSDRDQAAS